MQTYTLEHYLDPITLIRLQKKEIDLQMVINEIKPKLKDQFSLLVSAASPEIQLSEEWNAFRTVDVQKFTNQEWAKYNSFREFIDNIRTKIAENCLPLSGHITITNIEQLNDKFGILFKLSKQFDYEIMVNVSICITQ